MGYSRIKKLIVKYITNSISFSELEELDSLLHQYGNEKQFREFVQANYFIEFSLKKYNAHNSKRSLLNEIRNDKQSIEVYKWRKVLAYAAVALLMLGLGYFLRLSVTETHFTPNSSSKANFITLEQENGNIKVLSEDGTSIIKDSKGKIVGKQLGNKMIYDKMAQEETLSYNTINVPYGKQFQLQLSDGTHVYLNSGSSFRYPVNFLEGKERKVFLAGEAFLEVSEDKDRPFIVTSDDLNIKVLGTEFNVSAYSDDPLKEVVLVKGSVELYDGYRDDISTNSTILMPGMKGNYDKGRKSITTEPVVVGIYTSWVDGELVFRNMTFEEILKKLERRYDVTIINENSDMSQVTFNASFGNMPVGQIFQYFQSVYGIEFTVDHDKIIIH